MFQIQEMVLKRELSYHGHVILTYNIQYPKIVSQSSSYAIERFNRFNRMKALELKLYAERDLFQDAKEVFDYNMANGYPIMVFELDLDYVVTLNEDSLISLYLDEYTFTGGAHGSTIRTSQNWNMQRGIQFTLDAVFPNDCSYLLFVLRDINRQIAEQIENGTGQYFDNYCQLVLDSFKLNQFYLTPQHVVIYFQQYDIAPYSSGIPTFKIPR